MVQEGVGSNGLGPAHIPALDKLVGVGVGYAERKKGSHIKFFHFNDHTVISQETHSYIFPFAEIPLASAVLAQIFLLHINI